MQKIIFDKNELQKEVTKLKKFLFDNNLPKRRIAEYLGIDEQQVYKFFNCQRPFNEREQKKIDKLYSSRAILQELQDITVKKRADKYKAKSELMRNFWAKLKNGA